MNLLLFIIIKKNNKMDEEEEYISVYTKTGTGEKAHPYVQCEADVFIDGKKIGKTSAGGARRGGGLCGIRIRNGRKLDIGVEETSGRRLSLKGFIADGTYNTVIFNFTTSEVDIY